MHLLFKDQQDESTEVCLAKTHAGLFVVQLNFNTVYIYIYIYIYILYI